MNFSIYVHTIFGINNIQFVICEIPGNILNNNEVWNYKTRIYTPWNANSFAQTSVYAVKLKQRVTEKPNIDDVNILVYVIESPVFKRLNLYWSRCANFIIGPEPEC